VHLFRSRLGQLSPRIALATEVTDEDDSQIVIKPPCVCPQTMFRPSLFHGSVRKNHVVIAEMVHVSPIERAEAAQLMELVPSGKCQRGSSPCARAGLNRGWH
jgi:hypothetical protein